MGCFLRLVVWQFAAGCFAAWLGLSPARAGAFMQLPGEGQVIATFRQSQSSSKFDARGRSRRSASYSKSEIQAYGEYGLSEWMTLVFAPSVQHIRIQNAQPPSYAGVGDSELAARLRLMAFGPVVLSAQAGAVSRGDWLGIGHRGLTGKAALQADMRLLAGAGFDCGPWACFADVQAAWRSAPVHSVAEWRADLTLGVRPTPALLVLAQSFTSFYSGKARSNKLQTSVVYDLSTRISVQAGGFVSLSGRNAPREHGFFSAIWYRF